MAKSIPARSEVDPQFTWAITDMYPSDEAWYEELKTMRGLVADAASYKGRLGESAASLLGFLRAMDAINAAGNKFINYAFRRADEDTRNADYQAMSAQAQNFLVDMSKALAFETPELLAIPDETIDAFFREEPALEHYRLVITRERRKKPHTLSAECEALLAAAGQLSQAPDDIFSMLNDADLTFPDAVDGKGEAHPLTHGTYIAYVQSEDRALRESAFRSLYSTYGQFRNTSASVLSAQMKQLQFFADARHYESALHAALDETEVPVEIYHNLIDAVHRNLPAMHRYIRLRKRLLGADKLHYYDIYAPMVEGQEIAVSFEEAKDQARKALAPLGEGYLKILEEGFQNRWIDVYENQGKRSGAYSAGAFGTHPFVLLNYTDTLNDAFTLVHEMGHAIHSYLSNTTQSVTYADYKIFVAEVASTCNESLLMQYLLGQTQDPRRRAYLINYFLEQFRTTLYRQTMFAEFELWCSEQIAKGEALTAESLCRKYGELNALYYGEDIEPDEEIALEWARIPHFYYNFYVYQYATGFACAIALSQRILREGEPAVKDYLGFLSGGCSTDPISLLRGAGVDISTPAPVDDALRLFDSLIGEMEELAGKE